MPNQPQEQDAPQPENPTFSEPERIEELPEWAQRIIRETRNEAKERRLQLDKLETARQREQEARLEDEKRWQELAEQRKQELEALKPFQDRVNEMEEALKNTVQTRIERLPEDMRTLVPDFSDPRQTLQWLDVNEPRLMRPLAPNMDAGARGDTTPRHTKLSEEDRQLARLMGIDPEDLAAFKKRRDKQERGWLQGVQSRMNAQNTEDNDG